VGRKIIFLAEVKRRRFHKDKFNMVGRALGNIIQQ
jgi:hypothetical protein